MTPQRHTDGSFLWRWPLFRSFLGGLLASIFDPSIIYQLTLTWQYQKNLLQLFEKTHDVAEDLEFMVLLVHRNPWPIGPSDSSVTKVSHMGESQFYREPRPTCTIYDGELPPITTFLFGWVDTLSARESLPLSPLKAMPRWLRWPACFSRRG